MCWALRMQRSRGHRTPSLIAAQRADSYCDVKRTVWAMASDTFSEISADYDNKKGQSHLCTFVWTQGPTEAWRREIQVTKLLIKRQKQVKVGHLSITPASRRPSGTGSTRPVGL